MVRPSCHLLVLPLLAGLSPLACVAPAWQGEVVSVISGTSLLVLRGDQTIAVRLPGPGAPPPGRPFGHLARHQLVKRVLGRTVKVAGVRWGPDGYLLARVNLDGRPLETWRAPISGWPILPGSVPGSWRPVGPDPPRSPEPRRRALLGPAGPRQGSQSRAGTDSRR